MTKTKKILSVLLATIMLFACCGLSSFAIEFPADLEAGAATIRGMGSISSVEIAVGAAYTDIDDEAEFSVYYSATGDALDFEKVGSVGEDSAYVQGGVLHLNLSSLKLSAEGYYYVFISYGALEYETADDVDYCSMLGSSDQAQYQFASLGILDKLAAVIDTIVAMISNLIANGELY